MDRRPLKSRNVPVFQALASWLGRRGVTPNAISVASMAFALGAGASVLFADRHDGSLQHTLWFVAAVCVQLRLLANMLDGMVAVESGNTGPVGELFNEAPDRVSDVAILVPLGFVAGSSIQLGYAAALLALFVAYLRAIGGVAGAGQVFAGVMSKPKRMFFVTLLCLFQALTPDAWRAARPVFGLGPTGLLLVLVCAGCIVTSVSRWREIRRRLEAST